MFHVRMSIDEFFPRIGNISGDTALDLHEEISRGRIRDRTKDKREGISISKTFIGGILILTVVLGAFGAQAMTSVENEGKAIEPQGRYMCAGATWPQIPAVCLEGGSGREVRYASAPAVDQVASDIAGRFNVVFE